MSLDISESIGVKAYVDTTLLAVLNRMIFQLVLSVLMIVIACICLAYLSKTIFNQHKLEKARQTFVSTMTHEFKRPLTNATVLLDMAKRLLHTNEPQQVEEKIDKTQFHLKKLNAYTQRIQEINKNADSPIRLEIKPVNIEDFFHTILTSYQKNACIELSVNTKRAEMNIDEIHFSNILDNLIENAIKYSDPPAHISINVVEDVQN